MAKIGFVGLGNMGGPMAENLLKAGHELTVFDLNPSSLEAARAAGASIAKDLQEAAAGAEFIVSMLPAGKHVEGVYTGESGLIAAASPGTVLIDCSTIDVETARAVQSAAAEQGLEMVDAPVSGGVAGAAAGTLTFMVGGTEAAFAKAQPILEVMGKTVVHTGGAGTGQAAKICNNMMLGIQMISVAEAFGLAEKLGLEAEKLFAVSSTASGQCWSLTSYCPVPGLVETAPSNREYAPGFTADMMLKDLKLAQQASAAAGAVTPLGAAAESLYALLQAHGEGNKDFSAIIRMLSPTD